MENLNCFFIHRYQSTYYKQAGVNWRKPTTTEFGEKDTRVGVEELEGFRNMLHITIRLAEYWR